MNIQRFAAGFAACTLAFSAAHATTIGKGAAKERVAAAENAEASLLDKLPALRQIDQVVRDDCAAKAPSHASTDSFCTCAAAVTMSLWRSGMDPAMVGRLQEFLNGSGALKAADFVKFEGPELYRPLCELGA